MKYKSTEMLVLLSHLWQWKVKIYWKTLQCLLLNFVYHFRSISQTGSFEWKCNVQGKCFSSVHSQIRPSITISYLQVNIMNSLKFWISLWIFIVHCRKVLSETRCSDHRCLQDKSLSELLRAQAEIEVYSFLSLT